MRVFSSVFAGKFSDYRIIQRLRSDILNTFPTTADIYLEIDGVKVAVVQDYKAETTRSAKQVEAFGSSEAVGTAGSTIKHVVSLSRLYATDEAIRDGIRFYELENFSLVICKPDSKIVYTDCQWNRIGESGSVGGLVMEQVSLVAKNRLEIRV